MKKLWHWIKRYKLYYLLLLPILYVVYYLNTASAALDEVENYLLSTTKVTVTNGDPVIFQGVNPKDTAIIFYPGGKVKPEAYAPLMYRLAEEGYTSYLCKMPFNLAVFDSGAAGKIIKAHPEVKHWILSGHSLGGVMAAQYAYKHPTEVAGLVLMASYPIDSASLKDSDLASLSFYGEKDGLVNVAEIPAHMKLLPKNQQIEIIKGGNHGQFGYYGDQKGDQKADISREAQQKFILDKTLLWLGQFESSK